MEENKEIEPQTYICLGNLETENIEFDLITFKEKGQKVKYFSININTLGENSNSSSISLDEEAFKNVKKYFEQIDWNS